MSCGQAKTISLWITSLKTHFQSALHWMNNIIRHTNIFIIHNQGRATIKDKENIYGNTNVQILRREKSVTYILIYSNEYKLTTFKRLSLRKCWEVHREKGKLLFSSVEKVKLIHAHWLPCSSKIHYIWLNGGLRVNLNLYAHKFPIMNSMYLYSTNYLQSMALGASKQCVLFEKRKYFSNIERIQIKIYSHTSIEQNMLHFVRCI